MIEMSNEQLDFQERLNTGTSKTNDLGFEKNGYLFLKDLWDPKELLLPVLRTDGTI